MFDAADVAAWLFSVCVLVKVVAFLDTLNWLYMMITWGLEVSHLWIS